MREILRRVPSLPRGRLLHAHIRRTIVVSVVIHLAIALFTSGQVIVFLPAAFAAFLVVVACLALVDTRNRHETVFLANLGVSRGAVALLWCTCAIVVELLAVAYLWIQQL